MTQDEHYMAQLQGKQAADRERASSEGEYCSMCDSMQPRSCSERGDTGTCAPSRSLRERLANMAAAKREKEIHELDYLLADDLKLKTPPAMPSNPKQFYGDTKVPLHLFPSTAIAGGAMALLEGKLKYGSDNFRAAPVEAMTYVRAGIGHLTAWGEGRDIDPDSGLDELFKALACVAILIDAKYAGSLIDNRKFPGGYHELVKSLEKDVARLKEMHADKNPKHYTIADREDDADRRAAGAHAEWVSGQ